MLPECLCSPGGAPRRFPAENKRKTRPPATTAAAPASVGLPGLGVPVGKTRWSCPAGRQPGSRPSWEETGWMLPALTLAPRSGSVCYAGTFSFLLETKEYTSGSYFLKDVFFSVALAAGVEPLASACASPVPPSCGGILPSLPGRAWGCRVASLWASWHGLDPLCHGVTSRGAGC